MIKTQFLTDHKLDTQTLIISECSFDGVVEYPLSLIIAVDLSSSMNSYHKLDIVKESLLFILDFLHDDTHLILVGFSANASVLFNDKLSDITRSNFRSVVTQLRTNLHTNLSRVVELCCYLYPSTPKNSRIVNFLFTDGIPNKGITEIGTWLSFVDNITAVHPFFCFGVGDDHDPRFLHALSKKTLGCNHFIGGPLEIPIFLSGCLGNILSTKIFDLEIEVPTTPWRNKWHMYQEWTGDVPPKLSVDIYSDYFVEKENSFIVKVSDLSLQESRSVTWCSPPVQAPITLRFKIWKENTLVEKYVLLNDKPQYSHKVQEELLKFWIGSALEAKLMSHLNSQKILFCKIKAAMYADHDCSTCLNLLKTVFTESLKDTTKVITEFGGRVSDYTSTEYLFNDMTEAMIKKSSTLTRNYK